MRSASLFCLLCLVSSCLIWSSAAGAAEPGCIVNLTSHDIHGRIERLGSGLGFSHGDFHVQPHDAWCRTLSEGDYLVTRLLGGLEFDRVLHVSRNGQEDLKDRVHFPDGAPPGWLVLYEDCDEL